MVYKIQHFSKAKFFVLLSLKNACKNSHSFRQKHSLPEYLRIFFISAQLLVLMKVNKKIESFERGSISNGQ